MQTKLMNIKSTPKAHELKNVLGKEVYECYTVLSQFIIHNLKPEIEIWDNAGRRGVYFQRYQKVNKLLLIDLYFISNNGRKLLCEIKLTKSLFNKILKEKETFDKKIQDRINVTLGFINNKNGLYFDFFVDTDSLKDALKIIEIIS